MAGVGDRAKAIHARRRSMRTSAWCILYVAQGQTSVESCGKPGLGINGCYRDLMVFCQERGNKGGGVTGGSQVHNIPACLHNRIARRWGRRRFSPEREKFLDGACSARNHREPCRRPTKRGFTFCFQSCMQKTTLESSVGSTGTQIILVLGGTELLRGVQCC